MKRIRIFSFILIFIGVFIKLYFYVSFSYDIKSQNELIDEVFNVDVSNDESGEVVNLKSTVIDYDSFMGYIFIPRFNIKRIIKYGTDDNILNNLYVGIHKLSGSLYDKDMIILAGHDVSNVFSKLHYISIGDEVFINGYDLNRKFVVYDKKIVAEYNSDYLLSNRKNELLLITCTKKSGERLLVFLKEVLWIF